MAVLGQAQRVDKFVTVYPGPVFRRRTVIDVIFMFSRSVARTPAFRDVKIPLPAVANLRVDNPRVGRSPGWQFPLSVFWLNLHCFTPFLRG